MDNSQTYEVGARLELDSKAIIHNLNFHRTNLGPACELMPVVKANAYGSGMNFVRELLRQGVNRLVVAYPNEAYYLRTEGIEVPIMIINPGIPDWGDFAKNKFEPEVFSIEQIAALKNYRGQQKLGIHLQINTGMNRLGINLEDLDLALEQLHLLDKSVNILSLATHLAAADSAEHDKFTQDQLKKLGHASQKANNKWGEEVPLQVLNSSGSLRHAGESFDMARIGLGLHGISQVEEYRKQLMPVEALYAHLVQIREVEEPETVGYSRAGKVSGKRTIGVLDIGYADGLPRLLSQGKGRVLTKEGYAPIVGNVCMDMTMIDITGKELQVGETVEVFGKNISIEELAISAQSINYEILTGLSSRVKRVLV